MQSLALNRADTLKKGQFKIWTKLNNLLNGSTLVGHVFGDIGWRELISISISYAD